MKNKDREELFNKFGGRCAYCGIELVNGWHADHIEPIIRDSKYSKSKGRFVLTGGCERPHNENIDNYNPSCPSCNIQKNSFTLEQFRFNIQRFVTSLNRDSTQYKFAKKYGLIAETEKKVEFYFEKINKT